MDPTAVGAARRQLEDQYLRPSVAPARYQQLLRQALWAHNREAYDEERRLYKQVLDLLHAENKDPYNGLTGQIDARDPPNDRHLEELLATLVDD